MKRKEDKPSFTYEERLEAMLLTLLDQVDYTRGACSPTEMVGAVLPREVIKLARNLLRDGKGAKK